MIGNDDSTRAVARRLDQVDAIGFIRHFQSGGSWDTLPAAKNAIYLEQIKMDLVALAHEVEAQLAAHYQSKDLIDRA